MFVAAAAMGESSPGAASAVASQTHHDSAAHLQLTRPSEAERMAGSVLGKRTAETAQLQVKFVRCTDLQFVSMEKSYLHPEHQA